MSKEIKKLVSTTPDFFIEFNDVFFYVADLLFHYCDVYF